MSDMIIPATEFNATTDFTYTKPRINKAGGKAIGIVNKSTNRQLHISMPLMLTWGVNERVDESSGRVSYDMSLQFPKEEYATDATRQALAAIEAMERQVQKDAIANSKEWFNKAKLTEGQVEVLFNPMLYYSKDKETGERKEGVAPTLRVKLDCYDDVFKAEVYDVDSQPLYPSKTDESITPVDLITKGCNVVTSLKCGGVYFVNGKFGVTWRLHQAIVKPRASMSGKCMLSVSKDDVARMTTAQEDEEDTEGVEVVAESDDEESVSEEPSFKASAKVEVKAAVEEEKPKTVKKRVVRRKKAADE
jgi:hypothetical protein